MSQALQLFTKIIDLLSDPTNRSINLSLNDVHHNDIFSLVVDGSEFGKLTRIFIAGKRLRPFEVQLHTHRYPIRLTPITGNITHHTAKYSSGGLSISQYNYRSPMNDGTGLTYHSEVSISCEDYKIPLGASAHLSVSDFHTMSVSKGAMWVVEEQGFEVEESKVLGIPFVTDGLYNKPQMFQVNDKRQMVLRTLKSILNNYHL